MTGATIEASPDLWQQMRNHLSNRETEQAGFFIAVFDGASQVFRLIDWRGLTADEFDHQGKYHLELADEVRPQMLQWATANDATLVEAHSHLLDDYAGFSWSDVSGLAVWVPHVRWRLSAKPYAAIVVDGDTVDALAWIDEDAQQVERIDLVGANGITPTRRTLTAPRGWEP